MNVLEKKITNVNKQKANFTQGNVIVHEKIKPFKCDLCGSIFTI